MFNAWIYKGTDRIGLLENVQSLQWLEKYYEVGEFQLVCLASPKNIELLKIDNIIYNSGGDTAGIIEAIEIDDDYKEATITARGHLTAYYLDRRAVISTVNINNVEVGMRSMVNSNLRGLPVQLGTLKNYIDTLDMQITWNSIREGLETISSASNLGFKCIFDPYVASNKFTVYKGIDRTSGKVGFNGYFGDDIGNIINTKILNDYSDYKNVAVVAGRGTGTARKIVWVGNVATGVRRELYVDADDIENTYREGTDTGTVDEDGNPIINYVDKTYTDSEYTAVLKARGLEKLSELVPINTFSTEIVVGEQMKYKEDFNLGDIVTCKSVKYGTQLDVRITEIKEVFEPTGYQIIATLGEPIRRLK